MPWHRHDNRAGLELDAAVGGQVLEQVADQQITLRHADPGGPAATCPSGNTRCLNLPAGLVSGHTSRCPDAYAETQEGDMSISPHESDLAAGADAAVRPFRIEFPQDAIDDLRRRIKATRWPEQETVADDSQGVPLQTMQDLLRYWGTEYDWSACEARLNALPNFVTEVDGLDIHFLHIRSDHEDALPLIVTHGWPGSIIEQLKII